MPQDISILLINALTPTVNECTERVQLRHCALCQRQSENDGLLEDSPKRNMMQVSHLNNLGNGSVANTTRRIVDDATQCLLVVRIGHNAEVGNDVFDFLTLIETQAPIYSIRYAIFAHLFLKRTTLRIGAIQNGKIAILSPLLPTDSLNVIADDDGLLLVAVGRLQGQTFALFVLAKDILADLAFILENQGVSSLNNELCRAIGLL